MREAFAQLHGGLQSAHLRHLNIQNGEIKRQAGGVLQSLPPVARLGRHHQVVLPGKKGRERFAELRRVVR